MAPEPPAILTSILPSDWRFKAVSEEVISKVPPAGPVIEAPPSASTKVKSPTFEICKESVPLPISTRSVALNKTSSEEVKVISPVPDVRAKAVVVVLFPIVMVLAAAPVPTLIF